MDFPSDKVESLITRLDSQVMSLSPRVSAATRPAVERWRSDAQALRFHLRRNPGTAPPVLVVLGGTGTGKSTVVNRMLGQNVTATSFRRTFTTGPVAVAADGRQVPPAWLGVEHLKIGPADLPARGRAGSLLVATLNSELTGRLTIVDTPDLDGDRPAHHAEADRAFRWADAVLFLVTPEKYQMTELLPYYRLAARYRLSTVFVMNKCEQQVVADDYQKLLATVGFESAQPFVLPRDDAGFEPAAGQSLQALQNFLVRLPAAEATLRTEGLSRRIEDLLGRLGDQVLTPLRDDRREIDRVISVLRGMETPVPGVDVNPITQELERRMQQRSVLYLMGPQRILDRVRQAPGLLVRLPRVAWDYVMRGEVSAGALVPGNGGDPGKTPDFPAILSDQFAVLQSRLDDAMRSSATLRRWAEAAPDLPWAAAILDQKEAARIAEQELAALKTWLEQRWNATPRDTRVLESLLKYLPGGKQITRWTEAAPYLLVLVVAAATHHLFGGMDLVVLGGWSLATWMTERLSNEVAAHTRQTNQKITDRFTRLVHDQIERVCKWLDEQSPPMQPLSALERIMEEGRELIVPRDQDYSGKG